MELDSFNHGGKWYTLGERYASFNSEHEVQSFIDNSEEIEKEYTVLPPLVFILGGVVRK